MLWDPTRIQYTGPEGFGYIIGSGNAGNSVGKGSFDNSRVVGGPTIETFEDNDLSNYTDSGGTWSITNGPRTPPEGNYYLHGEGDLSTSNHSLVATSGLNYYPTQGDTFRTWINTEGGIDNEKQGPGVVFGATGPPKNGEDAFVARLDNTDTSTYQYRVMVIRKFESGSLTNESRTDIGRIELNTEYEIEVEWTNGNIVASLYTYPGDNLVGSGSLSY